jgi:methylated-DNA-[protein]-cysteine S-methyltransferase
VLLTPVETAFGDLGIFWQHGDRGPTVLCVSLPNEPWSPQSGSSGVGSEITPGSCPEVDRLGDQMRRYLEGEPIQFGLDTVSLERCGDFQRKVLLAEHAIPRGSVSTYARVARVIGSPRAARAVGQALARNPFPLIIPCHRAVRTDGRLGGYRGGQSMKRALLQLEGVEFDADGRVLVGRFYY